MVKILLIQAWSFAVVGFVLGLLCFVAVRAALSNLSMVLTPNILHTVAAVSFVTCTLAALAAVRRVLTLDPAMVFRG